MIFDEIRKAGPFKAASDKLKRKNGTAELSGLSSASAAHFVCAFLKETSKKAVIITENELSGRKFREDMITLGGFEPERITELRPLEYMLYDVDARSGENERNRVKTLYRLAEGEWDAAVLSLSAAIQRLPEPETIRNSGIELKAGDNIDTGTIADRLSEMGYVRTPQVDGCGQFAIRGDIIDIFPGNAQNPYRIELFDTEIDTIRIFSTETQRTTDSAQSVLILPEKEIFIKNEAQALNIRTDLKAELFGLNPSSSAAISLRADIEKIKPYCGFPGFDKYIPYVLGEGSDVMDYCPGAILFVCNETDALSAADQAIDEFVRTAETVKNNSGLPERTLSMMRGSEETLSKLTEKAFSAAKITRFDENLSKSAIGFSVRTPEQAADNPDKLLEYIADRTEAGYRIVLLAESTGRERLLSNLLEDGGYAGRKDVSVATGSISESIEYPDLKLSVISSGGLFRHQKARIKRKLKGRAITAFAELKPGDLVVHDVHGIGRFDGIETLEVQGDKKDYIKIKYRDDGVVFVPTLQLDSVQKYIGGDDSEPQLSKLGSSEWKKATGRVKGSLRVYARELVELYAHRSQMTGYAFNPDTEWQREFESDFPYEETDDQLRCTDEIKADMEKPRPMERLLCGDVGYGKTEVALRAAFKAVVEGKQVAFLVPTTILAQQHFNNFVERFKKYPIKIDYLSRFRTAKERAAIERDLAAGKIDIIVGTHALVSDRVTFRSLGLVIVDEEQRFGVKHKEKLRERYPAVDTLTLSATPIPRTLHMSLSGIRDISVIEDPPQDRLPVQTYVAEWDPVMVKNAIYKELARHGQVFYLYNRVQTMDSKLKELAELVPEARIAAAHGQMAERDLEVVMTEFCRGDFDVLLCTSIIESGLDMPNVNTIIVENGERLGLSQLYQIRGRVGRSTRQAYAYITYRQGRELGEVAEKRLRAIRENTAFGSGFRIAMRDLEIRGAGSVLGEQQHGQIAAVGYETYCRLLAEVLEEEQKGEKARKPAAKCNVEMNAGGFIDPAYIEDEATRFDLYQKIAHVENREDAEELTDELIDRFGSVPDNVIRLMKVARIRHLAEKIGFTSVIEKDRRVVLYSTEKESANPSLLRPGLRTDDPVYVNFQKKYTGKVRLSRTQAGSIVTFTPFSVKEKGELLDKTLELMEDWAEIA